MQKYVVKLNDEFFGFKGISIYSIYSDGYSNLFLFYPYEDSFNSKAKYHVVSSYVFSRIKELFDSGAVVSFEDAE